MTEPERIRETAATVVRSDEFRDEFAPQVADRFVEGFAAEVPVDRDRLDAAVNATLTEPAFVAGFTEVLGDMYEVMFVATPPVEVDLSPLPDLHSTDSALGTMWRILLGVGVVLCAAGVATHPKTAVAFRRNGILFALGVGLQLGSMWVAFRCRQWCKQSAPSVLLAQRPGGSGCHASLLQRDSRRLPSPEWRPRFVVSMGDN
ncbi:MAG: hypothetical protein ACI8Y4_003126 [Candidatus Poriferisodalaceae bacterium]